MVLICHGCGVHGFRRNHGNASLRYDVTKNSRGVGVEYFSCSLYSSCLLSMEATLTEITALGKKYPLGNWRELGSSYLALADIAGIREAVQLSSPKPGGFTHLTIIMFSKRGSSDLHFSHLRWMWFSTRSSHSKPSWHSSWSNCFPTKTTGATMPSGSYIELTVERIPRRVKGLSWSSKRTKWC